VHTSLALDASGNPHISCAQADLSQTTALMYTEKSSGIWSTETVFTSYPDDGYESALVLDALGNPHISYTVTDNSTSKRTVYYATRASGVWSTQIVDTSGNAGPWNDIDLDLSGNPHIVYVDEAGAQLKYASYVGGAWSTQIADPGPDVGGHVSLVIDYFNYAQISYTNAAGALKYVKDYAGSWVPLIVDDLVTADYTSIAVDASNVAHIAYTNRGPAEVQLKFAMKPG
jgi:hypothetical protein